MVALVAHGLSYAHHPGTPLVSNAHFTLREGWHGLVGPNGAGKTTLLRLLAGLLCPDEGSVRLTPTDARVHLVADGDPFATLDDGREGRRLRGVLGVAVDGVGGSPGERRRRVLAAALARAPDVLLLDEPSTHLDADGRRRVIAALAAFRGVGIVASHDRELLDALTHTTLRLHGGTVEVRPGPYSSARDDWTREAEAEARDRAAARARAEQAASRLDDARRVHASARRGTSTRDRMKGPRDHDARGALAKGKAAMAEARAGRVVAVRRAEAERARAEAASHGVEPRTLGRDLFVGWKPAPRPHVLSHGHDTLAVGGRLLVRDVRVTIGRRDRIRIAGPNGTGKTTLLRALLETHRGPEGSVVLVPQELDPAGAVDAARRVRDLPRDARGRVASLLAALGADPARVLGSAAPSAGEGRKLAFAWALGTRPWLVALDEPTNHLDLPTVERLEAAVAAYPGALLLVTHDDAFARACKVETWTIEDGRLRR